MSSQIQSHSSVSQSPPRHSPNFYLDDKLVIFQVEDELYKVNSHLLVRESAAFRDMFSLPNGANVTAITEGMDNEHPIRLEGTTKQEFNALLEFLYHGMHDDYDPTTEIWLAILSIADRYTFDKIRPRAVREIEAQRLSVEPVERIILAKRFNLPEWLYPAYIQIVSTNVSSTADASLTHDEADKLGLRTTLMIMRARAKWDRERRAGYRRNMKEIIDEEVSLMEAAGN